MTLLVFQLKLFPPVGVGGWLAGSNGNKANLSQLSSGLLSIYVSMDQGQMLLLFVVAVHVHFVPLVPLLGPLQEAGLLLESVLMHNNNRPQHQKTLYSRENPNNVTVLTFVTVDMIRK